MKSSGNDCDLRVARGAFLISFDKRNQVMFDI